MKDQLYVLLIVALKSRTSPPRDLDDVEVRHFVHTAFAVSQAHALTTAEAEAALRFPKSQGWQRIIVDAGTLPGDTLERGFECSSVGAQVEVLM